mmetsp:Transcript_1029/g.1842  ORF Transcript_1029/g.1842 Transcript_1029/m.1842 type:complete len:117 (-) Transcript_1029:102-452(-)
MHECSPVSFASNNPHAFLALNAGLGSYPSWIKTMVDLLQMKCPFAFSEQTKVSLRFVQEIWMGSVLNTALQNGYPIKIPRTEIKLNPFHGVVNRDGAAVLVPNINNGYILTGNKQK